jgi:hypothetical protein
MSSVPDRARRRAVRAWAQATGVPYSVAARQLDATGGALPASQGRTIYPASTDTHRHWLVKRRDRRPAAERVLDAWRAADLPYGRAGHLAERFPPTRGEPGTGVGPLYHGAARCAALALLYLLLAAESPDLVPAPGDLAWVAEMGEETAVDTACAALDRAARLALDHPRFRLRARVEAVAASAAWPDPVSWSGAGHILDAVLIVADDGHAPGTRVRLVARGRTGTIVSALWGPTGPPYGYLVLVDGDPAPVPADPDDLLLVLGRPGPVPGRTGPPRAASSGGAVAGQDGGRR